MYNWENQQLLIQLHEHFHQNRDLFNHHLFNFPTYIDHSCILCYPQPAFNTCTPQFQIFWNWFIINSTARRYSQKTTEFFDQLLRARTQRELLNLIDRVLFSIRFRNREYRDTLSPLIQNCLDYTHRFTRNLNRINNLRNLDEYTTSESETTPEEPTESESEEEPESAMDAAAPQILNALQAISNRLAIRSNVPMPVFVGGTQDPVQWLEEFEQAAQANQYTDNYKLAVVSGYLLNEAQTWHQGVIALGGAGNFQSWGNVNNRNFRNMFLTHFRTPEKVLQWRFDLQSRIQSATESVDQYAQEIKRLIKRVDHLNAWTDQEKIYQFTKGLRREIVYQLKPHLTLQPGMTFEQAIALARQFEQNNKEFPEAMLGFNAQTINQPVVSNQQNNDIETVVAKALGPLIQALNGLNLQSGNNAQSPPNNNFQNTFNQGPSQNRRGPGRPPRQPMTCYKCNQVGHLMRNCPTNLPPQNNQPNQGTPINNQNMLGATHFYAQQAQTPQVPMQQPQPMQQPIAQPIQQPMQTIQLNQNQNPPAQVLMVTQEETVNQPVQQTYSNEHLNYQTHL